MRAVTTAAAEMLGSAGTKSLIQPNYVKAGQKMTVTQSLANDRVLLATSVPMLAFSLNNPKHREVERRHNFSVTEQIVGDHVKSIGIVGLLVICIASTHISRLGPFTIASVEPEHVGQGCTQAWRRTTYQKRRRVPQGKKANAQTMEDVYHARGAGVLAERHESGARFVQHALVVDHADVLLPPRLAR
ncbi:unnamed protein product [Protopolystoma xenopodis]|uniref:Uncharacterized protein n=1 Tax=Protopolystoma xenopodis TaxID=117903 RepID=A0A3S5B635_9PLAT|nr:unnamed protein product [Protopolystoma xenopodis]